MNSFIRVLRLTMRRRWSLLGIALSSLLIAVLWGANIGTLYPLVEVVFKGDSLPGYAEKKLATARAEVASIEKEIAALQRQLAEPRGKEAAAEAARGDGARGDGARGDGARAEETEALERQIASRRGIAEAYNSSIEWVLSVKPWIDAYTPRDAFSTLVLIVAALILGTSLKLIALATNLLLVQNVAERTSIDLRSMFFRKALHLDLDAFGDNGSAELTARLTNDISHVSAGVGVLLGRLVREPLKMIVCLVGAALICWRLLFLVMVLMPLVAWVMHQLSRSIRRASRRAMEEMSQLYGVLNDAFAGIRVVKSFNTQSYERARFRRRLDSYYRKSMKMAFYNTLARGSSEWLGMSVVGLAILAGGYLVLNQQTHLLGCGCRRYRWASPRS